MKSWNQFQAEGAWEGCALELGERDFVIYLKKPHRVISTSRLSGGVREDLSALFNHCDRSRESSVCNMMGDTYEEHLSWCASQIGLLPKESTGLSTAVEMSRTQSATTSWNNLRVDVLATGGILHNGRRAGDLATLEEKDGRILSTSGGSAAYPNGTINLFVHINADLDAAALAAALMIASEAKVAVIQDLGITSSYSDRLATGSGTDGVVIASDMHSPCCLTRCATDTKLGECLAQAVYDALRAALENDIERLREKGDYVALAKLRTEGLGKG